MDFEIVASTLKKKDYEAQRKGRIKAIENGEGLEKPLGHDMFMMYQCVHISACFCKKRFGPLKRIFLEIAILPVPMTTRSL